jgi:hypothetical protein
MCALQFSQAEQNKLTTINGEETIEKNKKSSMLLSISRQLNVL